MDDFLRDFIVKKWKIGSFTFTFLDALLAVCITGTGIFLRIPIMTDYYDEKLRAIPLEYVLAVVCAAIVYRCTKSGSRAFLTYAILVIYPTIAAIGAIWNVNAVYDAIFIFVGFYLCLTGSRVLRAIGTVSILLGALPQLFRYGWTVPYDPNPRLSYGWPNFYEIIGKTAFVDLFDKVFLLFLAGLLLTMLYCFAKKKIRITTDIALQLFLFLAVLIPYFAPYMSAWDGYTADIAALLYFMRRKDRFYLPMLHLIVSYSAYAYAINGETKLPMVVFSVILLGILVNVGVDLYREAAAQTAPAAAGLTGTEQADEASVREAEAQGAKS